MTSALAIERRAFHGGTLVVLRGEIDDSLDVGALAGGLTGAVVFDLDEVRRITSYGVREWMRALKQLTAAYVGFINVRPALVSQFNMVAGFAGNGEILSLYLPYLCEWCDSEQERLLDLTRDHAVATAGEAPKHKCSTCQAEMEFDDIPESYFAFVGSRAVPSPPPAVRKFLDRTGDGGDDVVDGPLKVQKEVAEDLTAIWISGRVDKQLRVRRIADGLEGRVVVACRGITSMDDTGKERFVELTDAKGCELYVARLPAMVATSLGADLARLSGKLASVDVRATCANCGTSCPIELDALSFAMFVDDERSLRCPTCRATATPAFHAAAVAGIAPHLSTTLPPDLHEYLGERTGMFIPDGTSSEALQSEDASSRSAAAVLDVEPESRLATYTVVRQIGQGGMAEVFLAEQRGMQGFQKRVVIKKILPMLRNHRVFLEMFFQEARVAAQVSHQNVVQIFDLGIDQGIPFIVMEYVRGWDLRSIIATCRRIGVPMPVEFACRIVSGMAAGLHAAHVATDSSGMPLGIVHRDVSPHNVLISVEGAVKITDFGVSKAEASSLETKPGQIKGKIVYMAPEQIDESLGVIDARSDVFAAGIVLYECLTGESLFRRDNEFKIMNAVLTGEIPDVRTQRPDVPEDVARLLARALERKQSERLARALDLELGLEEALVKLARPATGAHFANWLTGLQERSSQFDELSAPMRLPTAQTPGLDATLTVDMGNVVVHRTVSSKKA